MIYDLLMHCQNFVGNFCICILSHNFYFFLSFFFFFFGSVWFCYQVDGGFIELYYESSLCFNIVKHFENRNSLVAQMIKNLPVMQETQVRSLDQEDTLEKGMATHSSILVQRVLWTEEPGSLQSTESQRIRHDRVTNLSLSL